MDEGVTALIELTADIVAAYIANSPVPPADLPRLIESVNAALAGLGTPVEAPKPELVPAVPVKKSITPDHLISLEDGRKFKSLRRHLGILGMTPQEYRAKWDLPADYPMVAANYAAKRSELAKSLGLGRKKAADSGEALVSPRVVAVPKKRGRPPKAKVRAELPVEE